MFEIFALLINFLIVAIVEAMVACYLFSFYLYMWSSPTQRILTTIFYVHMRKLPREFATGFSVEICNRNLPWLLAMRICRENLAWLFAVGFFVFLSKSFCVYISKSCLYGSKPFLYLSKTIFFVRFGSYGSPYVIGI